MKCIHEKVSGLGNTSKTIAKYEDILKIIVLITNEKFTLRDLEIENKYCEGCKNEAIKYHSEIIARLEELIRYKEKYDD